MRIKTTGRRVSVVSRLAVVAVVGALFAWGPSPTPLVPLSASGKTVAHAPGGKPIKSAAVAKKAPEAHMFRIDHGAGEPTLGITKSGTVFITTGDSCVTSCPGSTESIDTVAPGGRAVFASSNEGKTWKEVSPKLGPAYTHVLSLDPMLYVDEATDRVFDIDLTVACSILSFSDDEGKSWISNPLACGEPVNDHQTVFAGPPVSSPTVAYPNIVYYCFNHPAYTKCSKSLDGGINFVTTANITPPDCSGLNGHGVVNNEGIVYIPIGNCGPDLAISKDEGDTWEVVRVSDLPAGGGDPSVAVDKSGNLYYLFVNGDDRLPYLVTSRDGGKSWSKPIMVAPSGVKETNLATVDVGDYGNVAIAYYGTTADTQPTHWSGYLATGYDLFDKHPVFYTATVNDPSEPFKVGNCGPGRCGRVLDFIDVEISPKGEAWGAFVDACMKECEKADEENIHDNGAVVGALLGGPRLR